MGTSCIYGVICFFGFLSNRPAARQQTTELAGIPDSSLQALNVTTSTDALQRRIYTPFPHKGLKQSPAHLPST